MRLAARHASRCENKGEATSNFARDRARSSDIPSVYRPLARVHQSRVNEVHIQARPSAPLHLKGTKMSLAYRKHLQLRHSEGHSDGVTAVSFSSTGDFLASGGLDGRVCVWDMHAGELRYVFSGNSAVLCLEWLPPTLSIVCGMEDGTLALLSIVHVSAKFFRHEMCDDLLVEQDVMMVNGFWAHQYPVERLAYSGDQLASGAHKEVKVWTYLPKAKGVYYRNCERRTVRCFRQSSSKILCFKTLHQALTTPMPMYSRLGYIGYLPGGGLKFWRLPT